MPNFLKYLEWLNTMSCIHYKCARPHVQVIVSVMCASQNKIKIYTFSCYYAISTEDILKLY